MKTIQKVFLARILSKMIIFVLRRANMVISRNGLKWAVDLNEGIELSIFLFGGFEKSITKIAKRLLNDNNLDIIDIGANMGIHSLNLAKIYSSSKIYSIEPTNYSFNKFLENLKINKSLTNIFPHQLFITNLQIKPNETYSSWSLNSDDRKHKKHKGIKKSTSNALPVSFDDFIANNKIFRKTLIKCDVDGNELIVFKSGKNYLEKYKPMIIMELAPYLYNEYGYSYQDLLNYLKQFNYEFYDGNTYEKITDIFEYSKNIKDGSSTNIFLK